MLNFYDFIQVFVSTINHHLKCSWIYEANHLTTNKLEHMSLHECFAASALKGICLKLLLHLKGYLLSSKPKNRAKH